MTTTGAPLSDIDNWLQDTAASTADFTSEVFQGIQSGAISAAEAQGKVADAFAQDFQRYSDSAARHAENAATSGNARAAEVLNRISDTFANVAAERQGLSAEAYNQKIASQALDGFAGAAKNIGPAADIIQAGFGVAELISTGDFNTLGEALSDISGSVAGAFIGAALVGLLIGPAVAGGAIIGGIIIGAFAVGGGIAGKEIWNNFGGGINNFVNDFFFSARNWVQRRDPLTLDLDGDGLETVGIDPLNPILFDHDGDGVKNATGWISPDDGFLVLDRNGNGTIDDGTELFGDSTPLLDAAGVEIGKAEDGFAALAAQDSNHDGVVNALDANWNDLRIWQDANSDGLSQEGELKTLESLDIVGIRVAKIENTVRLANGNQIADLGTFIKSDGSENTLGNVSGNLADVDLADNPFFREFTDTLDTSAVAGLPDMQGSGTVRDLREAASLNPALASTLTTYAATTTRAAQLAQADAIITQWAASSGFATSIEKAAVNNYQLAYLVPGQTRPAPLFGSFGSGSGGITLPTAAEIAQRAALLAQQQQVTQLIALLEKFNGITFVNIEPQGVRTGANQFLVASAGETTASSGGLSTGGGAVYVPLSAAQIDFMNRSYAALRQSIYDGLLLQTRLKPYTDAINLTLTDPSTGSGQAQGIGLDFSGVDAALQTRFDTTPGEAVRDLLDLQRVAGPTLNGSGWNGLEQLRGWLVDAANGADPALTATLVAALGEFGYPSLVTSGNGGSGNDVVIGAASDANAGAVLNGNGGNDLVLGSNSSDVLNGGAGADTLYGGAGNDTYVFNLGDGADTIIETHGVTDTDALILGSGILAGELDIFIEGDKLVFAHSNGKDRIAIANWFDSISDSAHRLDAVTFADGRNLDLNALQLGTAGNDTLTGTAANDILMGGPGNDILTGEAGDDWLNGGTGADQMAGGLGDDIYVVDNALDTVTEAADEGTDTVFARISATLSDNVENITLVGTSGINGTGNALDNILTGNAANNTLAGMDGTDPGCPWQNGRIERFFGTLKQKLDQWQVPDLMQLNRDLSTFRNWYNLIRPHQNLNGKTPAEAWNGINTYAKSPKAEYAFHAWEGLLTGYELRY